MNLLRFKQFLLEGGNVQIKLDSGKTIAAQKIPMDKVSRKEIQKLVLDSLKALNSAFQKEYKTPLWKNFNDLVKQEMLFSGSSRSFFAKYINDKDFASKKKTVGDIDIMFPESLNNQLVKFLDDNKGKMFGKLKFVAEGGNSPTQQNTLFELPEEYWDRIRFVQIDFEPVSFEGDVPTEFSLFAHYSSWKDISEGIKGVFVKYLYRALFSNIDKLTNYAIVTDTGKLSKSKKFENEIGMYKFSVDKGVRIAYEPVIENGKQKVIDGKLIFKEIPTSNSNYEQSLGTIFALAYKKEASSSDLKNMKSFVGSLDILKSSNLNHKLIYLDFIRLLWGDGAQGLERSNPELDFENKKAAHDKFIEVFPDLKEFDEKVQSMIDKYYKNYKRT